MDMDYTERLHEFHRAFGHHIEYRPTIGNVPTNVKMLRKRLIEEEKHELFDAIDTNDLVEVADGLADLLYVVFGTAISFGIPIDQIFEVVHKSNMAKLGPDGKPITDKGGKSMKPAGWVGPTEEIRRILYVFSSTTLKELANESGRPNDSGTV